MPGGNVSVKVLVRMAATSLVLPKVIVIWLVAPLVIVAGEKPMLETVGGLAVCAAAETACVTISTPDTSMQALSAIDLLGAFNCDGDITFVLGSKRGRVS
jgi:hypothetical protein